MKIRIQEFDFDNAKVTLIGVSLLFVFLGNFLISVKSNYVLGFSIYMDARK